MQKGSKKPTDRNTLFRIYGLLIDNILDAFCVPRPRTAAKKQLHGAFKDAHGIGSLRILDNVSLSSYIESIKRYFATEQGIYIRSANEPEGVHRMTLSQYLQSMENIAKQKVFDQLETLYNFHSHRERKRFLCDLTDTPLTSTIGNEERLIENIREWLDFK